MRSLRNWCCITKGNTQNKEYTKLNLKYKNQIVVLNNCNMENIKQNTEVTNTKSEIW